MAYEHKDNSGSLFENDRKETDNHPDYKGSCKVNGVEYWLSAWVNEREGKGEYLSLKFQPMEKTDGPVERKTLHLNKDKKESKGEEFSRMTGGGDRDTVADDEISDGLSKEFDKDVPF